MSEIGDAIQAKCLAFGDGVIKLNDYLLELAAKKHQPSSINHHSIYSDAEELVKILVARCKKLNQQTGIKNNVKDNEILTW